MQYKGWAETNGTWRSCSSPVFGMVQGSVLSQGRMQQIQCIGRVPGDLRPLSPHIFCGSCSFHDYLLLPPNSTCRMFCRKRTTEKCSATPKKASIERNGMDLHPATARRPLEHQKEPSGRLVGCLRRADTTKIGMHESGTARVRGFSGGDSLAATMILLLVGSPTLLYPSLIRHMG